MARSTLQLRGIKPATTMSLQLPSSSDIQWVALNCGTVIRSGSRARKLHYSRAVSNMQIDSMAATSSGWQHERQPGLQPVLQLGGQQVRGSCRSSCTRCVTGCSVHNVHPSNLHTFRPSGFVMEGSKGSYPTYLVVYTVRD